MYQLYVSALNNKTVTIAAAHSTCTINPVITLLLVKDNDSNNNFIYRVQTTSVGGALKHKRKAGNSGRQNNNIRTKQTSR